MSDEVLGDLTATRARDVALLRGPVRIDDPMAYRARSQGDERGDPLDGVVFAVEWPSDAGELALVRVKEARDAEFYGGIAAVAGLREFTVRRRLEEAHGADVVSAVFAGNWPSEEEDDQYAGRVAFGDLTVARAQRHHDAVALIAGLTAYTQPTVPQRLRDAHSASRIRRLFAARRPRGPNALGDLRIRQTRGCGPHPEIAAPTGQGQETVLRWLMQGLRGAVLEQSVRAACDALLKLGVQLGLMPEVLRSRKMSVHMVTMAEPKDGPSAGLAFGLAMLSAAPMRPIRRTLAVTGKLLIHGNVTPVGGIAAKLHAAYQHGRNMVIIQAANAFELSRLREVTAHLDVRLLQTLVETVELAVEG